jgi:hypothetical protein
MALPLLSGCGEQAALKVDDVSFTPTELLGRSEAQIEELTLLTAVGIAVSRGEVERLGETVLRPAADDRLLVRLAEEDGLLSAGIDEETLEGWYLENLEPELLVRHLVILSERWDSTEKRSRSAGRAREALERVRQGEPFPDVAGEVSEEPGAEARGGLLAPGREGSWVREFWFAAASLEVGEVSGVVETQYGFHVLKLEERRAVPFAEARPRAVSRLVAEMALLPPAGRAGTGVPSSDSDREARMEEAHLRGVELTPEEWAAIWNPWVARVERWGAAFGFEEGMTPEELSVQALVALGLSHQDAMISRRELAEWAEPLTSTYAIERNTR